MKFKVVSAASDGCASGPGGCRSDDKGVVLHYEATAVPVDRGRTGFLAFCTGDSGCYGTTLTDPQQTAWHRGEPFQS